MTRSRLSVLVPALSCVLLVLLWLPSLKYPVVSDAVNYGLLGRSLWMTGTYALHGVPYANHLPLFAAFSFPFTQLFGFHLGMHVASLMGGMGVLLGAYVLTRLSTKNVAVAIVTMLAVLVHPAFVLLAMGGSSDLLFTALCLFSLWGFVKAGDDARWYVLAGALLGLACLTRYNGAPVFALYGMWILWKRPRHLRSPWMWWGMGLGACLFSLWFIRNAVTFGNPFHSNYLGELGQEAPSPLRQLLANLQYYLNPIHNVFPFFFVFAFIGLWRYARRNMFLVWAIVALSCISLIWWVQAIRFLFPALVLLLIFAAWGLRDTALWLRGRGLIAVVGLLVAAGLGIQGLSMCVYTYGECNAFFDRTVGVLPKNMGLSTEGFYTWHVARLALNRLAEPGAVVRYEFPEETRGIFRPDLRVSNDPSLCPAYEINQQTEHRGQVVYKTADAPVTFVVKRPCE